MGTVPDEVDLRTSIGPVRDQGHRSTCLAFATTAAHEHLRSHGEALSPEALIAGFVQRDPTADSDGTTIPIADSALSEDGQCDEAAWPYGEPNPIDTNAPFYKAHLNETNDDLVSFSRACLTAGQVVVLGLVVTDAWENVAADGILHGPSVSDRVVTAHAVIAVGYRASTEMILIRNSWGSKWGLNGHAWVSDSYVRAYGVCGAVVVAA